MHAAVPGSQARGGDRAGSCRKTQAGERKIPVSAEWDRSEQDALQPTSRTAVALRAYRKGGCQKRGDHRDTRELASVELGPRRGGQADEVRDSH